MKIETKLDIGDEAFILMDDKVHKVEIKEMVIMVCRNHLGVDYCKITYEITKNPVRESYTTRFNESELFKTKQELLESL